MSKKLHADYLLVLKYSFTIRTKLENTEMLQNIIL